jgi:hypothetical protein
MMQTPLIQEATSSVGRSGGGGRLTFNQPSTCYDPELSMLASDLDGCGKSAYKMERGVTLGFGALYGSYGNESSTQQMRSFHEGLFEAASSAVFIVLMGTIGTVAALWFGIWAGALEFTAMAVVKPTIDFLNFFGIDLFLNQLCKPLSQALMDTLIAPIATAVSHIYSNYRGRCVMVLEGGGAAASKTLDSVL